MFDLARTAGIYPVMAGSADVAHAQVATADVGAVAARALLAPAARSDQAARGETIDVLGPAVTEREVAEVLGRALGRPLEVVVLPEAAWPGALQDAGLPAHAAASLAELYRADDAGLLAPRGDRVERGETGLAQTVERLVAVG